MGQKLKIAGVCLLIAAFAYGVWLFTSDKNNNISGDTDSVVSEESSVVTAANSDEETTSSKEVPPMTGTVEQAGAGFRSYPIMPGVWEITDGTAESPSFVDIYLVAGAKKALVIDAGVSGYDLAGFVRTLTDKPVDLVLTHGHGDHVAAAAQFETVYMSERDFALIRPYTHFPDFEASGIRDLKGGEVLDLGGCKLEVLALPGHTAGSMLLLDRERQLLFAGDALGSGSLWLQLPESSTVEEFRDEMLQLEKSLKGLSDLKPYLGHSCLMQRKPDRNYITDTRIAAEKVVSGELTGKPSDRKEYPGSVTVSYGQMFDLLYRPEKVLKNNN